MTMGAPDTPPSVQLFCGIITSDIQLMEAIRARLADAFGPEDFQSVVFEFDHTKFYEKEMGGGLKKLFVAYEKLIPPEDIVDIKHKTNALESEYESEGGARTVNLDPGYVSLISVVLATTKPAGHRVYMGRGIHGEATMGFAAKTFHPFERTYPDYRKEEYIEFFNTLRKRYVKKLRLNIE